jgi:hypothetical protein
LKEKGNRAAVEVLIQWKGMPEEDATWEDFETFQHRFLDLMGKVF